MNKIYNSDDDFSKDVLINNDENEKFYNDVISENSEYEKKYHIKNKIEVDSTEFFSKNPYGKKFSDINSKQSTQKASLLISEFNDYLIKIHEHAEDLEKFFSVYSYVYSTLEDEFKKATMQKMLNILNNIFKNSLNDTGSYTTVYIGRHQSKNSEPGILSLVQNFQDNFLSKAEYRKIFDDIRKINGPDNTKNIIQGLLFNFPINISKKWIDTLWSKEEQNLSYINLKPIAENNNQAFSYLVSDFKGWENKSSLNTFFKFAYLGQNNIDNLKKNIVTVAPQIADEPVELLLKRKDLSESGKIDILKNLFNDLSKNYNVFQFLSDYLLNGSSKKEAFEQAPFHFSKSIINHLSSLSAFEKSFSQVEKMIDAKLIDKDACSDISKLLENIQPSALVDVKPNTILILATLIEQKITSKQKTDILGRVFFAVFKKDTNIKSDHFTKLYELWINDLDKNYFSEIIKEKINDTGINLKICSHYKFIDSLGGIEFKKDLFNKIYKENVLGVSFVSNDDNHNLWLKNLQENNKLWSYYDNFFKIENINIDTDKVGAHLNSFISLVDVIKKQRPDIELNLKEKNPLIQKIDDLNLFFSNTCKELPLNIYYLNSIYPKLNTSLSQLTNDVFEGKISQHDFKDRNLQQTLNDLNYTLRNTQMSVNDIIKPGVKIKESFSFMGLFKNKEVIEEIKPYYLSMKNQALNISLEPNVIETPEGLNKSDFISKAHKEYGQIKKYLESVSEKSLNLEVKIKSNNLMLDYLNFVTLIDSAKTMVKIEDLHFLENNLGTYLLESLRSYTKNVDRFEIMQKAHDSGNFKKLFSGKNEEDIQNLKEKSDKECLRWIQLLEEQLELVKKNIIEQINDDGIHDMRVRTKFLSAKFPEASLQLEPEKNPTIKIR